jgi:ABC-type uncharacterized transport system substrate-binding protein
MLPSMKILARIAAAACVAAAFVSPAGAHPHVWVTVTSHVLYDAKGEATGLRQTWKFDDMYSTFALEGLPQKTKGVFTREELAPLAEVNMTTLKDSDYFTFAKIGGKDVGFADPSDYWLDYKDEVLTLIFTLPFKTPQKTKDLSIEVYDPSYFVDFSFAEKEAVALIGAPAQCKAAIQKPKESGLGVGQQVMSDAQAMAMMDNLGQNYASKIAVNCP